MIKRRRDIPRFIKNFTTIAKWDGIKYYLLFGDTTLMRYDDGSFTYYKKNDLFSNIWEQGIVPEEIEEFIWKHRKEINFSFSKISS